MSLSNIKAALLTVSNNIHHFNATGAEGDYIVWGEDGQGDALYADGEMKSQVITGTIDYFTRTEYGPAFYAIQNALSAAGISHRLNSVQHEEDTGYSHYEWVWEVI